MKMLAGGLIGAALGIAAEMMVFESKLGAKVRKGVKRTAADFYEYLSGQAARIREMSEDEFNKLVQEGVKNFAKVKKLTAHEQKIIADEAKKSWGHLKKHFGEHLK